MDLVMNVLIVIGLVTGVVSFWAAIYKLISSDSSSTWSEAYTASASLLFLLSVLLVLADWAS